MTKTEQHERAGSTDMVGVVDAMEQLLQKLEVARPGQHVERMKLAGGRSQLTMLFSVSGRPEGAVRRVVVKHAGPDGPLAPHDVTTEGTMIELGGSAGMRAPGLVGVEPAADGNGGFVVMEYVAGAAPGLAQIVAWLAERGELARATMVRSIADVLAASRAIATVAPGHSNMDLERHYEHYITGYVERLVTAANGSLTVPRSVHVAADWLRDSWKELAPADPALVHGDFRVGNLIFDEGGDVAAVVDWERAMIGHPYHDAGYLCLPGMRLDGRICGVFEDHEFASALSTATGASFDRLACAYFRIMSMFTELCTMLRAQLRGNPAGALRQSRSLPLIITIQRDLLDSITRWDHGDLAL